MEIPPDNNENNENEQKKDEIKEPEVNIKENPITNNKKDNSKKIITMKCSMIQPPLNTEAVIPPSKRRFSLPLKNFVIYDSDKSIFNNNINNINEESGNDSYKRKKNKSIKIPQKRMFIKTNEEEKKNKININNLPTIDSNIINTTNKDEIKKQLEEHWNYQIILLDYNIIDFTSKSKYLFYIISNYSLNIILFF